MCTEAKSESGKMKIYIAGPMRGYKNFNKDNFNQAEEYLASQGYETVNPVKLDTQKGILLESETGSVQDIPGFSQKMLEDIVKTDVEAILGCDGIYMMDGWKNSKGAQAEHAIAEWLGLKIIYENHTDTPVTGIKYDNEKPNWSLLDLSIISDVVSVLTYGANKYAPDNWKCVDKNRYFSACLRHLTAYQHGEPVDEETGISHLAHAACCIHFMQWHEKNN